MGICGFIWPLAMLLRAYSHREKKEAQSEKDKKNMKKNQSEKH